MENSSGDPEARMVRGNQEDFDLVIAFDRTVILIEAKAYGRFTSTQIEGKLQRLRQLTAFAGSNPRPPRSAITFRMLLTSPNQPDEAEIGGFDWARRTGIPWMPLTIAPTLDIVSVTRCDERSVSTEAGGHWRVDRPRVTRRISRPSEGRRSAPQDVIECPT